MYSLKIRAVGSSSGVVLPKELLAELGVKQGQSLHFTRAPGGAFRVTPVDETFQRQMAVAEEIMAEDRDIFRALAKR
jgi:putative addiction module antidote